MNKKYALLITIALIAHITNTAEQDNLIDGLKKQTEKDCGKVILPGIVNPGEEPIVIEDNERADHVKVILRNIGKETCLLKETGSLVDYYDFFMFDEPHSSKDCCKIFYEKGDNFLAACILKEQDDDDQKPRREGFGYSLRSAIDPGQRKICYNEEKRELTITIPRINEEKRELDNHYSENNRTKLVYELFKQDKGIDGNGE